MKSRTGYILVGAGGIVLGLAIGIGAMVAANNDTTPPAQAAPVAKPVENQPAITHGPAPTELFVDYAADIDGIVHEGSGFACAPTYTTVDLLVGGTVTYGKLPIHTVLTPNALEITYNGPNASHALIITGQNGKEYQVPVPEGARPTLGVGSDKQHTMWIGLQNVPGHQVTGVASCSHSR